jgi:outer membrane protein assembly factor BamB
MRAILPAGLLLIGACVDAPTPILVDPQSPPGPSVPSPTLLWATPGAKSLGTRPVVSGDLVYVASADVHSVTALDKSTGLVKWTTQLPNPRWGLGGKGLALAGGRLVVGDAEVYGLDPLTGVVVWRFEPSAGQQPGWRRLASDGTTVYCGAGHGGYLYAVDGRTGVEKWAVKVSPDSEVGVASPVLMDGVVYAGYINDQAPPMGLGASVFGGVVAVDAVTGAIRWNKLLPRANPTYSSGTYEVAASGDRVFAWAKDGPVYVMSAQSGDIQITVPASAFVFPGGILRLPEAERHISVLGDTVVVISASNVSIAAFLLPSMSRLWVKEAFAGSPDDVVLRSPFAYGASVGGSALVWRLSNGNLVWWRAGGFQGVAVYGAPGFDGNTFFLGGADSAFAWRWPDS